MDEKGCYTSNPDGNSCLRHLCRTSAELGSLVENLPTACNQMRQL